MDMEASGWKRRKFAAPQGEFSPAPATVEAPDTRLPPSAHTQQPAPGLCAAGEGADHISDLPDALLGEIISLLPIRDGAPTRILASRWRNLWLSAPLNLDCRDLARRGDELAGAVSRILSSHQSSVRRFCVDAIDLSDIRNFDNDLNATVQAWLGSAALDNLHELHLWCARTNCWLLHVPLPASTLRFSPTLRALTIGRCHITDGITQSLHLPRLKELTIEHIMISECSLHSLIAGCPALERFLSRRTYGLDCVRINSLTLRSISLSANALDFRQLVIENAPCLERLLCYNMTSFPNVSLSFSSAPKLETIGWISNWHDPSAKLVFGSTIIQGLRVDNLTTVVSTVKTLALKMDTLCLDTVIGLMRCFPCLERMYIHLDNQSRSASKKNLWRRKHRNLITCLDIRLKTIVLEYYKGIMSQVHFVTFFVLNAKVLESMTLQVVDNCEKFIAEHRRKLQLENRVSRGAQFHFRTDRCLSDVFDMKHLRDQSDPFIRRR